MEYLEDFHVWTSVLSRPSGSGLLHTPRLTVAFAVLCAYAGLTALLTTVGQEQVGPSLPLPDLQCGAFLTQELAKCTVLRERLMQGKRPVGLEGIRRGLQGSGLRGKQAQACLS